jgi:hypothetical protein
MNAGVIVKGELHSNMGDLEEEKELVKQGFDVLVLEGQKTESDYGWTDGWFQISLVAFFWLAGRIYVSEEILLDLAETQDTLMTYVVDDELFCGLARPNSLELSFQNRRNPS